MGEQLTVLEGSRRVTPAEHLHNGDVVTWQGVDHVVRKVWRVAANRVRVVFDTGDFEDVAPELNFIVLAHVADIAAFLLGCCYEHPSGWIIRIVGSAHTRRHGYTLLAETPGNENLLPVADVGVEEGWQQITEHDYEAQWQKDVAALADPPLELEGSCPLHGAYANAKATCPDCAVFTAEGS